MNVSHSCWLLWLAQASAFISIEHLPHRSSTTLVPERLASPPFSITTPHAVQASLSFLQRPKSSLFSNSFDSIEEFEATRKSFENLWAHQHRQEKVDPADIRRYYSLLSQRHEQEIRLIRSLDYRDDAVKELLKLWSTTIVPPAGYCLTAEVPCDETPNTMLTLDANILHTASSDAVQDREAQALTVLHSQHPDWAEPCLRLAAYYHRRQDVVQSYEWALKGLTIQPYHFVSSNIFLILSVHNGNNAEVEYWEHMRLPTSFGNRRKAWVERAVHECQDKFRERATEIRKLLDSHRKVEAPIAAQAQSSAASVTMMSDMSDAQAFQQLKPMRHDADTNSMFGNFVDPWESHMQQRHNYRHQRFSPHHAPHMCDWNPRPNFGDDHWSNNPSGVFDIHGNVRSAYGENFPDASYVNFHAPPSPSFTPHRWSSSSSNPTYEQLEGISGEWE